jgi:ABC-type transport system substrate-binding protein
VTVEAAAYEDVLPRVLAQQTDAAVLGWDNLGFDPGTNPFWHSRHDVPGTGFNFVSYQDPDVDTWLDQARTAPGCDASTRADNFRQVQTRVDRDKPYLMLHGRYQGWLVNARWDGVEVGPWGPYASLSMWQLRE